MTYDEKLDLILERLSLIERALVLPTQPPAAVNTGGLYDFVRPVPVEPRYGKGAPMSEPDANEAKRRAMYCVDWTGTQTRSSDEDMVWAEIEKLKLAKAMDPVVTPYLDLDPEFCAFALLTNLIQPASQDGMSFGIEAQKRKGYAGYTIQSFLDAQWSVSGGPSGDSSEAPIGGTPRKLPKGLTPHLPEK